MFRTLTLNWKDDGAGERSQRYRINVPSVISWDPQSDLYSVELVDVPVARWTRDEQTTVWVLYDGNHDGMFDKTFGDAILMDASGEGRLDLDPYSDNFFSFHAPVEVPWGSFSVTELDPAGRFVQLEPIESLEEIEAARRFAIGRHRSGCRLQLARRHAGGIRRSHRPLPVGLPSGCPTAEPAPYTYSRSPRCCMTSTRSSCRRSG